MHCLFLAIVISTHTVALKPSTRVYPDGLPGPADSIYPDIRRMGCGHDNMQVPQLLDHEGKGRYVIDIGLGPDASETFQAVRRNFIVLGFEPMPGNMASIKDIVDKSDDLKTRVQFIYPTRTQHGTWMFPQLERPEAQNGSAYIFHAGLSGTESTACMPSGTSLVHSISSRDVDCSLVAVTTLDTVLPDWIRAAGVHMLKIDTQGWELPILRGASHSIQTNVFKYILYEFSPWLMKRAGNAQVGSADDLLFLLPHAGGLCFDMMGSHHILTRPTSPLRDYFESLNSGSNSIHPSSENGYRTDDIGPWEDIMCYMPDGGAAYWKNESSVTRGIDQVLKDVCVNESSDA